MRSISRFVLGLSLVTLGTLVVTDAAWAKKGGTVTYKEIENTGISQFDEVFGKAKAIQDSLAAQEATLTTARTNANTALGVAADGDLGDAIAALSNAAGGKLGMEMKGTAPHLTVASGADATVTKGAEGVNGLIDAGTTTVTTVNALVPQVTALVTACKDFPATLKTLGLDAATLLKATPIVAKDVAAVGQTPGRITAITDAVAAIYADVTDAFKK